MDLHDPSSLWHVLLLLVGSRAPVAARFMTRGGKLGPGAALVDRRAHGGEPSEGPGGSPANSSLTKQAEAQTSLVLLWRHRTALPHTEIPPAWGFQVMLTVAWVTGAK